MVCGKDFCFGVVYGVVVCVKIKLFYFGKGQDVGFGFCCVIFGCGKVDVDVLIVFDDQMVVVVVVEIGVWIVLFVGVVIMECGFVMGWVLVKEVGIVVFVNCLIDCGCVQDVVILGWYLDFCEMLDKVVGELCIFEFFVVEMVVCDL